ncbi:MAG: hypothetical protein V4451_13265 [Pseudomonadota bacterium]
MTSTLKVKTINLINVVARNIIASPKTAAAKKSFRPAARQEKRMTFFHTAADCIPGRRAQAAATSPQGF